MSSHRRLPPYGNLPPLFAVLLNLLWAFAAGADSRPASLLRDADESVRWAPAADFAREIDLIPPPEQPPFRAPPRPESDRYRNPAELSARVEQKEIEAELEKARLSREDRTRVLTLYQTARTTIRQLGNDDYPTRRAILEAQRKDSAPPSPLLPILPDMDLPVPPGLSEEFADHLRALAALYSLHPAEARGHWERVLARPVPARMCRTVAAAYGIGKTYLDEGRPADAITWFRKTREFAGDGHRDPLGLAASSYGWEATAEAERGDLHRATELYLVQRASGDGVAALALLDLSARLVSRPPERLDKVAADPLAARVTTAYVIAQAGPERTTPSPDLVGRWLAAVEGAGTWKAVGPDRLALAAYQVRDDALADKWLARSGDSALALWLRAKRMVAAGDTESAVTTYQKAMKAFPANEQWRGVRGGFRDDNYERTLYPAERAAGELGVIQMARGRYVEALDLFRGNRYLEDATYVVERVLTPDEVVAWFDRQPPGEVISALRPVVARRLARVGRRQEARRYFDFDPKSRALLDDYAAALRTAGDDTLSDDDRADALWKAANIAYYNGRQLLDCELDVAGSHTYSGVFYPGNMMDARRHAADRKGRTLPPTADELRRVGESAPNPNRRWVSQYVAADHAWAAAALMPDESDETARVLCKAGQWLNTRDPAASHRFYRALVDRCATTRQGREAAKMQALPAVK